MKIKLILGLLLGFVFSGYALAQDNAATDAQATFNQLDADQDGAISMEEATRLQGLSDKFGAADADGDGKLVLSEFTAVQQ